MDKSDETLLTMAASFPRRLLGAGSIAALGVLLLSLVFDMQGLWSLVFLVSGLLTLYAALRLWRATEDTIVLTRTELRTGSGRVLTEVSNVQGVDRGAFAFKPSNGFLVKLKEPSGSGWAPGLWWQRGRYIGVGGVVRGGEARGMAELLTAAKDGTLDRYL